jgi:hypothetical protein
MNDVVRITAALVAGGLVVTSFFVVLAALFPEQLARTGHLAGRSPGRSVVAGLINAVFFLALILALMAVAEWMRLQILSLPALLLIALLGTAVTFGVGGVVQLVGERLLPERGGLARTAAGALAVYLACWAPFVGWFGMTVYVALLGLGAFILSFIDRAPRRDE